MVGGKNSKRGWWPWQIGLYKYNDEGKLKSDVVVLVCSEYGKLTSQFKIPIAPPENSTFFVNINK